MSEEIENKQGLIRLLSNELAEEHDADVFWYNFEIGSPVDFMFIREVADRKKRKNVIF